MTAAERIDALRACSTPDEVADMLEAGGFVGWPGAFGPSSDCPLAECFRACSDVDTALVDNFKVHLPGREPELMTDAMRGFVRLFDTGRYERLFSHESAKEDVR